MFYSWFGLSLFVYFGLKEVPNPSLYFTFTVYFSPSRSCSVIPAMVFISCMFFLSMTGFLQLRGFSASCSGHFSFYGHYILFVAYAWFLDPATRFICIGPPLVWFVGSSGPFSWCCPLFCWSPQFLLCSGFRSRIRMWWLPPCWFLLAPRCFSCRCFLSSGCLRLLVLLPW